MRAPHAFGDDKETAGGLVASFLMNRRYIVPGYQETLIPSLN